jgi:hypothetical protein
LFANSVAKRSCRSLICSATQPHTLEKESIPVQVNIRLFIRNIYISEWILSVVKNFGVVLNVQLASSLLSSRVTCENMCGSTTRLRKNLCAFLPTRDHRLNPFDILVIQKLFISLSCVVDWWIDVKYWSISPVCLVIPWPFLWK